MKKKKKKTIVKKCRVALTFFYLCKMLTYVHITLAQLLCIAVGCICFGALVGLVYARMTE